MFKAVLHWPTATRTKTFETLPDTCAAAVPHESMQGAEVVRDAPCPACGRMDLECDRCAPAGDARRKTLWQPVSSIGRYGKPGFGDGATSSPMLSSGRTRRGLRDDRRAGTKASCRIVQSRATSHETRCDVMKRTTQQAAEDTGKSRSTIWRAIKKGNLSAEKTGDGDYLIDASELERWRSSLAPAPSRIVARDVAVKPDKTTDETSRNKELDIELATLRERTVQQERRIREYEMEIGDLRADRDRWRAQTEATTRLLTDQRARPEQPTPARRPWWRRLPGRG